MNIVLRTLIALAVMTTSSQLFAQGTYQSNADFLKEAFDDRVPEPEMLWISRQIKRDVSEILGNPPSQLRVRYWQKEQKTAWILEEIGKEKLITMGFVVSNNEIEKLSVLAFRETRGWEIKHSFFTDQFNNVRLKEDLQLDKTIDGISGATLSVRAARKLARLALYYHRSVQSKS